MINQDNSIVTISKTVSDMTKTKIGLMDSMSELISMMEIPSPSQVKSLKSLMLLLKDIDQSLQTI